MDKILQSQRNNLRCATSGFALMELLVVIVVIGVIGALAITSIGNISDKANDNSARKTAKMIVSIAAGAQAAGDETVAAAADKAEAVQLLSDGLEGVGVFEGSTYKLGLEPEQAEKAMAFLVFREGKLEFQAPGTP